MLIFCEAEGVDPAHQRQMEDAVSCYVLEHTVLKETSEECGTGRQPSFLGSVQRLWAQSVPDGKFHVAV